jgi:glyoxylase-like metal-dependent hydrolase (beta-lactamase superfamily II)
MAEANYTKGLHAIGEGVYAYLQPDGSWGWSNAGLIVDGEASLLVDTLFDLDLTRDMLREMGQATTAAASIDTLVITHANGDHVYGNELVEGAEIIASRSCAEEMAETPPQMLAELSKAAPTMGELGEYFTSCFGKFNFEGIELTMPGRTFDGELTIHTGDKEIRLMEVGPCHTKGDVIVSVPGDGIVFAGDILFIGGTPIMWVGPVGNWIRACDMMLDMDADTFVPGHGPVTDKKGVAAIKGYWEFLTAEARKRFEQGEGPYEAATSIDLGAYNAWGERERTVINVSTLYQEFGYAGEPPSVIDLFTQMAAMAKA